MEPSNRKELAGFLRPIALHHRKGHYITLDGNSTKNEGTP